MVKFGVQLTVGDSSMANVVVSAAISKRILAGFVLLIFSSSACALDQSGTTGRLRQSSHEITRLENDLHILKGSEVRKIIVGRTLNFAGDSKSLIVTSNNQQVYHPNGSLTIRGDRANISGNWYIEKNYICITLDKLQFKLCRHVAVNNNKEYYFIDLSSNDVKLYPLRIIFDKTGH